MLKEYRARYKNYRLKLKELEKIESDEVRIAELIEFAEFEIEKIESISPKIDEDKELLQVKYRISKLDKISEALSVANGIFDFERSVNEIYRLLDKDNTFFTEMLNQLQVDFSDIEILREELLEVDIENILDRLEQIYHLKNRYGGIAEALEHLEKRRNEVAKYKNIEKDKSLLKSFIDVELNELTSIADKISQLRQKEH